MEGWWPVAMTRSALARLRVEIQAIAEQLWRDRWLLLALFLIQVVAYSYLYTTIAFGNHLFPNAWLNSFPSFRTWGEGRWLEDVIILLQGGSGVQSVQMVLATLLQACNALIFLRLLGIEKRAHLILLGGIFCLYPAFLDYYSFTSDHVAFVMGDALALLGFVLIVRLPGLPARVLAAALCWFLALSIYAPKAALIALFVLMLPLVKLVAQPALQGANRSPDPEICLPGPHRQRGMAMEDLLAGLGAMVLAMVSFWLSTKLLVTTPLEVRMYLNAPWEAMAQLPISFRHWLDVMVDGVASKSRLFALLPLLFVLMGFALMLWKALKLGWRNGLFTACVLLLIPPALHLTWMLNRFTPLDAGRYVTAYAYLLIFSLSQLLLWRRSRQVVVLLAALLFWCYFVLASQIVQATQIKGAYELGFINRLASRMEPLLDGDLKNPQPVVIFGRYPQFPIQEYVSWPLFAQKSQLLNTDAFAEFRQTDILNVVLGQRVLRPPTPAELEQARRASAKVQPWPAAGAVFREGQSVVVVIEPDRPGGSVTRPQ
jgi:hypothetical protein